MPLEKEQFMAKMKKDTFGYVALLSFGLALVLLLAYVASTARGCQESGFRSEVEKECIQRGTSCPDAFKLVKPREK